MQEGNTGKQKAEAKEKADMKGVKVITANPGFYDCFTTIPEETEGRQISELGNRQWDIPRLRELLDQIIPPNAAIADFVVEHNFPVIGFREMVLNARRLQRPADIHHPHQRRPHPGQGRERRAGIVTASAVARLIEPRPGNTGQGQQH